MRFYIDLIMGLIVACSINMLGSPHYLDRVHAYELISLMLQWNNNLEPIVKMGKESLDPQVRYSSDYILKQYRNIRPTVQFSHSDIESMFDQGMKKKEIVKIVSESSKTPTFSQKMPTYIEP